MEHQIFSGPLAALEEGLFAAIEGLQADDPLFPVEIVAGSHLVCVYLRRRYVEWR